MLSNPRAFPPCTPTKGDEHFYWEKKRGQSDCANSLRNTVPTARIAGKVIDAGYSKKKKKMIRPGLAQHEKKKRGE